MIEATSIQFILFSYFVVFLSIAIHETFHGIAALSEGDPTPKLEGRITLNPLSHIDPFGTIIFPLFLFFITLGQGPVIGWAKPVPVNPFFFRDKRKGIIKVSLAGPLSNFLIGVLFSLFCRFLPKNSPLFLPFQLITYYNFLLAFFNLLPIPPLDGFHLFFSLLPEKFSFIKIIFVRYSLLILVFVIFFLLDFLAWFAQFLFSFLSGV
ncbi:site-2 protease family protein [Candidatus Parcubacteria bacterium]|nr:site-2 protease family protein [Candidatus Parcubacteria bacterium]